MYGNMPEVLIFTLIFTYCYLQPQDAPYWVMFAAVTSVTDQLFVFMTVFCHNLF